MLENFFDILNGFRVNGAFPLDSRFTVADEEARLAIPSNAVYNGLWTFQTDVDILYIYEGDDNTNSPEFWVALQVNDIIPGDISYAFNDDGDTVVTLPFQDGSSAQFVVQRGIDGAEGAQTITVIGEFAEGSSPTPPTGGVFNIDTRILDTTDLTAGWFDPATQQVPALADGNAYFEASYTLIYSRITTTTVVPTWGNTVQLTGEQGPQGLTGPKGDAGSDGDDFIGVVATDGTSRGQTTIVQPRKRDEFGVVSDAGDPFRIQPGYTGDSVTDVATIVAGGPGQATIIQFETTSDTGIPGILPTQVSIPPGASGSGSGDVNISGTPGPNQYAKWVNGTHITGQTGVPQVDITGLSVDGDAELQTILSSFDTRIGAAVADVQVVNGFIRLTESDGTAIGTGFEILTSIVDGSAVPVTSEALHTEFATKADTDLSNVDSDLTDQEKSDFRDKIGVGASGTGFDIVAADDYHDVGSRVDITPDNTGDGTTTTLTTISYVEQGLTTKVNDSQLKQTNTNDANDIISTAGLTTELGSYLPLTGGTLTGDLNVGDGANRSLNVGADVHFTKGTVSYLQGDTSAKKAYYDPTNSSGGVITSDANEIANKAYVDSHGGVSGNVKLNPGGSQTVTTPSGSKMVFRGSFDVEDNNGDKVIDISGTSGDIHLEDDGAVKVLFDKSQGALYYQKANSSGGLSTATVNEVAVKGDLNALANEITTLEVQRNDQGQTLEEWEAAGNQANTFVADSAFSLTELALANDTTLLDNDSYSKVIVATENGNDYHFDLLRFQERGGRLVLQTDNLVNRLAAIDTAISNSGGIPKVATLSTTDLPNPQEGDFAYLTADWTDTSGTIDVKYYEGPFTYNGSLWVGLLNLPTITSGYPAGLYDSSVPFLNDSTMLAEDITNAGIHRVNNNFELVGNWQTRTEDANKLILDINVGADSGDIDVYDTDGEVVMHMDSSGKKMYYGTNINTSSLNANDEIATIGDLSGISGGNATVRVIQPTGPLLTEVATFDTGGGSVNEGEWYWRESQGTNTVLNPTSWADLVVANGDATTRHQIVFDTTVAQDGNVLTLSSLAVTQGYLFVATATGSAILGVSRFSGAASNDFRFDISSVENSTGTPGFSGSIRMSHLGFASVGNDDRVPNGIGNGHMLVWDHNLGIWREVSIIVDGLDDDGDDQPQSFGLNSIAEGVERRVTTREWQEAHFAPIGSGGDFKANGTVVANPDLRSDVAAIQSKYAAEVLTSGSNIGIQVDYDNFNRENLAFAALQADVVEIFAELSQHAYTWEEDNQITAIFITERSNKAGSASSGNNDQLDWSYRSSTHTLQAYAHLTDVQRDAMDAFVDQGLIVGLGPSEPTVIPFRVTDWKAIGTGTTTPGIGTYEMHLTMVGPDEPYYSSETITNASEFESWADYSIAYPGFGYTSYLYRTTNNNLAVARYDSDSAIVGSALTPDERLIVDGLVAGQFTGNLEITGNLTGDLIEYKNFQQGGYWNAWFFGMEAVFPNETIDGLTVDYTRYQAITGFTDTWYNIDDVTIDNGTLVASPGNSVWSTRTVGVAAHASSFNF